MKKASVTETAEAAFGGARKLRSDASEFLSEVSPHRVVGSEEAQKETMQKEKKPRSNREAG